MRTAFAGDQAQALGYMRIFVTVEDREGNPVQGALVQIACLETGAELADETGRSGKVEFELDSGYLDSVRCFIYCNGSRQGSFSVSDKDELLLT